MQEIYRFIDDAIEADRQRYTDIARSNLGSSRNTF